jgi:hypothetical protein
MRMSVDSFHLAGMRHLSRHNKAKIDVAGLIQFVDIPMEDI